MPTKDNEDLKGRTCATCACAYLVEPPKVPTAEQLRDNPNLATAKPVWVCRLNPPTTVITPNGPSVIQQPVQAYMSCWQWREPGTLPGDGVTTHPMGVCTLTTTVVDRQAKPMDAGVETTLIAAGKP